MKHEVAARFEELVTLLSTGLAEEDTALEPLAQLVAQLKYLRRVLDELHAYEVD